MSNAYDKAFDRSLEGSDGFWGDAAQEVDWHKTWDRVLDDKGKLFYRWFVGAECNLCNNALDRDVKSGRADQPASIFDSMVTGGTVRSYSYKEQRDEPAKFAYVLCGQGCAAGIGG